MKPSPKSKLSVNIETPSGKNLRLDLDRGTILELLLTQTGAIREKLQLIDNTDPGIKHERINFSKNLGSLRVNLSPEQMKNMANIQSLQRHKVQSLLSKKYPTWEDKLAASIEMLDFEEWDPSDPPNATLSDLHYNVYEACHKDLMDSAELSEELDLEDFLLLPTLYTPLDLHQKADFLIIVHIKENHTFMIPIDLTTNPKVKEDKSVVLSLHEILNKKKLLDKSRQIKLILESKIKESQGKILSPLETRLSSLAQKIPDAIFERVQEKISN